MGQTKIRKSDIRSGDHVYISPGWVSDGHWLVVKGDDGRFTSDATVKAVWPGVSVSEKDSDDQLRQVIPSRSKACCAFVRTELLMEVGKWCCRFYRDTQDGAVVLLQERYLRIVGDPDVVYQEPGESGTPVVIRDPGDGSEFDSCIMPVRSDDLPAWIRETLARAA